MKYTPLLPLLLLSQFHCFSQQTSVELIKMNVAYIGVPNPMSIVVENTPCSKVVVKTSEGRIDGSDCHFTYYPEKMGKSTIEVFVKADKGLVRKGVREIRVKRIPDPEITFAGITHGYISRAEMLSLNGPRITIPGFDFDMRIPLKTYTIQIRSALDSEVVFERRYWGDQINFDPETIRYISNAKQRDIILFSDIRTENPNGTSRKISDAEFIIVD
jgi:hypothetical protein